MDELRKYPNLYDTGRKNYKNARTTKTNAWRELARKFEGTKEMCETRYMVYLRTSKITQQDTAATLFYRKSF